MNLISGTHYSCERMKYAFMILQEYTIISPQNYVGIDTSHLLILFSYTNNLFKELVLLLYVRSRFSNWAQE